MGIFLSDEVENAIKKTYSLLSLNFFEAGDIWEDLYLKESYTASVTGDAVWEFKVPSGKRLVLHAYQFVILSGSPTNFNVKMTVNGRELLKRENITTDPLSTDSVDSDIPIRYIISAQETLRITADVTTTAACEILFRARGLLKGV